MVYIVYGESEIVIDMDAKRLALLCFGLSFAQAAGTFSCPSGQTEDLQCAASCCSQHGGVYSYMDQTCEVATTAQWNSTLQCEQQSSCCTSSGASGPGSSSGCCGPAALLGLVVVGAVAAGRKEK